MSNNELPPIQAWFINRQTPTGSAPEDIKEQWIDVPLPLRQLPSNETPEVHIGHGVGNFLDVQVIDDGMAIYAFDAIKALGLFNRSEAADFWDQMLYPDQTLIFRGAEGEVYPTPVLQRILPGIEFFDETEA